MYGVESNGTTSPKAMYSHQGPVLDVCWSKVSLIGEREALYKSSPECSSLAVLVYFFQDGNKIISCGADKAARLYDVSTGQQSQVAAHDAPIKNLRWIDQNGGILATGSWDKTVKVSNSSEASAEKHGKRSLTLFHCRPRLQYWDLRQSQPIATAQLAERCYTMDFAWPYLVVGCAERKIQVFDLSQNPSNAIMVSHRGRSYVPSAAGERVEAGARAPSLTTIMPFLTCLAML